MVLQGAGPQTFEQPKVQGDPSQRRYLLSRLASMFEANKARILSSDDVVAGQLLKKEKDELAAKAAGFEQAYKVIVRTARELSDRLARYKRTTGIDVWDGSRAPATILLPPTGKKLDPYKYHHQAKDKNRRRVEELRLLYMDAKGQILFKPKAIALDFIESVERKAARI